MVKEGTGEGVTGEEQLAVAGRRHNGKLFCYCLDCCRACIGTTTLKGTRVHEDDIPYIPFQRKIISCPYCFGTGRELEWNERMDFLRKQFKQEKEQKEREKEEQRIRRREIREIRKGFRREVQQILKTTDFKFKERTK